MAIYAIGDIQGCFAPLQRLLDSLAFNPAEDRLWFVGDLVSRGRHSLETLRAIKSWQEQGVAMTVLGNHDISLLAAAYGVMEPHKSLKPVMKAADCAELIEWLRQQPLLHYDPHYQAVLVHAGIPPGWDLDIAIQQAQQVERKLRQADPAQWLKAVYGNEPADWNACTSTAERHRYTINAFTRMRFCYPDGSLEFKQKLNPRAVRKSHPKLTPWFNHPDRVTFRQTVYFGHWSTLGYYQQHGVIALDTGCVWGGDLTAVRVDTDNKINYPIACSDYERREKG